MRGQITGHHVIETEDGRKYRFTKTVSGVAELIEDVSPVMCPGRLQRIIVLSGACVACSGPCARAANDR
jgi:hypothetical protein